MHPRDFVKKASVLGLVPLVSLPKGLPTVKHTPAPPASYPDAERVAVIQQWEGVFWEAVKKLARVRIFLAEARTKAPADVNAIALYDRIESVHETLDALPSQIDKVEFEDLFTLTTGQYSWHIYIERELAKDGCDFDWWQDEITAIGKNHPTESAHLQAVLDTKRGGVL